MSSPAKPPKGRLYTVGPLHDRSSGSNARRHPAFDPGSERRRGGRPRPQPEHRDRWSVFTTEEILEGAQSAVFEHELLFFEYEKLVSEHGLKT